MKVTTTKLLDVEVAFRAIPATGRVDKILGRVKAQGGYSHVQGIAVLPNHYVLTHSDENRESGRLLVAFRDSQANELEAWFAIPPFARPPDKPFYQHAGGCQLIGDCLVVPCETGQFERKGSVVAFVDMSDPTYPRELGALRIRRDIRAMAAGGTNLTRDGQDTWVVAVYEHGRVDFYESTALDGTTAFAKRGDSKVVEQGHQAFVLLTQTKDGTDQVFAVGLNTGEGSGTNTAILYRLTQDGGGNWRVDSVVAERNDYFKTTKGARLRWGSTLDIASNEKLVLYCTSKPFTKDCTLNIFDPDTPPSLRVTGRVTRKRVSRVRSKVRAAPRRTRSTGLRRTRRTR